MSAKCREEYHFDDSLLLDAVRTGDRRAYGELFRRYADSARVAARQWTSQPDEQQDLVAEAFTKTLNAIRNGAGPQESLRPYLMKTVNRLGIVWWRRRVEVPLYGSEPDVDAATRDGRPAAVDERVVRRWNIELARLAFRALPPRWRFVLWHTEVESRSLAELASRLDLSPNGVAALAMRAREGLRRAYLQAHVPRTEDTGCAAVRRHLGAWTRRAPSPVRSRLLVDHLAAWRDGQAPATMLAEINDELLTPAPRPRHNQLSKVDSASDAGRTSPGT